MIINSHGVFKTLHEYRRYLNSFRPEYEVVELVPGDLPEEHEIRICQQWIRHHCTPRVKVNAKAGTSYGLKHCVERWARRPVGAETVRGLVQEFGSYVSNGALIAAAKLEGYEPTLDFTREGPNCHFRWNVSNEGLEWR